MENFLYNTVNLNLTSILIWDKILFNKLFKKQFQKGLKYLTGLGKDAGQDLKRILSDLKNKKRCINSFNIFKYEIYPMRF